MDKWTEILRDMLEDEEPRIQYEIRSITMRIYNDLLTMRIREKLKFREQTGTEFQKWSENLELEFDADIVEEILSDDEFWKTTLKLTM